MTSPADLRRLRDGARALEASRVLPKTTADLLALLTLVEEAIAAMQSLDDLGAEVNARAGADLLTLFARHAAIKRRVRELESTP